MRLPTAIRLRGATTELEASRKRVSLAADQVRDRIERDLHDGAQQRLVALRVKLELLRELAADDPQSVARGLAIAGEEIVTLTRARCRRFSQEVENAVYFCCLEALQNVAKHCGPGARVDVRLRHEGDGWLTFEVRDDGPGFDLARPSDTHGLTGRVPADERHPVSRTAS